MRQTRKLVSDSASRSLTSRRTLLLAGVAAGPLVLAACSGSASSDPSSPADDDVAASAAAREQEIIALYDAVLAKPDGLGDAGALLQQIRDQHAEHLAAFGGSGDASAPAVGANPLASLRKAERALAAAHASAAKSASGEDVIRLLTVVGASESMHAVAIKKVST